MKQRDDTTTPNRARTNAKSSAATRLPVSAGRWGAVEVVGGLFSILVSIFFSCGLLIVNGALVMAVLAATSAAGATWLRRESVSQFLLFAVPVALLVAQWWMIDYVRSVFRRSTDE